MSKSDILPDEDRHPLQNPSFQSYLKKGNLHVVNYSLILQFKQGKAHQSKQGKARQSKQGKARLSKQGKARLSKQGKALRKK
jgi:hypothetical protein